MSFFKKTSTVVIFSVNENISLSLLSIFTMTLQKNFLFLFVFFAPILSVNAT